MVTLQRDVVNGLSTFWVDSGRPTLAASLIVRGGIADETLPTTGWLHLIEHLALHGRQSGALHVNGSVSLLTTQLDLHGPPAEVTRALGEICAWLRDPDLSRLVMESKVLAAESEFRGTGDSAVALLQRFGAQGAGLAGYTEPGLSRASAEGIADLIGRVFTAGNAVLALDGRPAADLDIRLPAGPPLALPEPPTTTDSRPAAYIINGPRMTVSGEVSRTAAGMMLPGIFQDQFRRILRDEAGGAYAPWATYEAVGPQTAVVIAGSDVTNEVRPGAVRHIFRALDSLRDAGPAVGVPDDLKASAAQGLRDPHQASMVAWRAAHSLLRGETPQSLEEVVADIEAVTADGIGRELASWRESLLFGVPGDATWNDELPMLRMPTSLAVPRGRRFRSHNFPADRSELVLGEDRVCVRNGADWRTVQFRKLAGVLALPDGARQVIDRSGWALALEPTQWLKGASAVEFLDHLGSPEMVLPMPARPPELVPARASWASRVVSLLRIVGPALAAMVGGAVVVLAGLFLGNILVPVSGALLFAVGAKRLYSWIGTPLPPDDDGLDSRA